MRRKIGVFFAVALLALTVVTVASADIMVGTTKANQIQGTSGYDLIRSRGGDDTVIGGGGPDAIYLGSGNDHAKAGLDGAFAYVRCGSGNDFVVVGPNVKVAGNCEHKTVDN